MEVQTRCWRLFRELARDLKRGAGFGQELLGNDENGFFSDLLDLKMLFKASGILVSARGQKISQEGEHCFTVIADGKAVLAAVIFIVFEKTELVIFLNFVSAGVGALVASHYNIEMPE